MTLRDLPDLSEGRRTFVYDVVVVGAGLAGLVAAARAAEDGARVGIVAGSPGDLGLWSGLVSADDGRYADGKATEFFLEYSARSGLPYVEVSGSMLTPAGRPRPCRLAPLAWKAGVVESWLGPEGEASLAGGLLVVGFTELGDYPAQPIACEAERRLGLRILHRSLSLGSSAGRGLETRLAYLFDDPVWFRTFLDTVGKVLSGEAASVRAVAFPPVLGLLRVDENLRELEARLGRPVFELPGLPPSVPGLRFWRRWRHQLERRGRVVFHLGRRLESAVDDGQACGLLLTRRAAFEARAFVLATGGVAGGGLEVRTGDFLTTGGFRPQDGPIRGLREPLLGLDSSGAGADWNTWGLTTDDEGRPNRDGRVFDNLFVAGWARQGIERTAYGSIQSGYTAGARAAERAGPRRTTEVAVT